MHDDFELGGKRLGRERYEERFIDTDSGEVFTAAFTKETTECFDGTVETTGTGEILLMGCPHPRRVGQPVAKCQACSASAGHPVFVCSRCHVQCPICGKGVCQQHSVPSPWGIRYCGRKCLKKGKKLLEVGASFRDSKSESPARKAASRPVPSVRPPAKNIGRLSHGLGNLAKSILEWW